LPSRFVQLLKYRPQLHELNPARIGKKVAAVGFRCTREPTG
jgi:hypothetical protein